MIEQWDNFVLCHPLGNIGSLSVWKNIIEESFQHIKGSILALTNEKEEIVAGIPFYIIKNWLTVNKIVCSPYSTLFDPLVSEKEHFTLLLHELEKIRQNNNCKYIEIKSIDSVHIVADDMLNSSSHYKHHILKIDENLEAMKKKLHRSCIRQPLSRAEKNGIKCREAKTVDDVNIFYHLYSQTRKRLGLPLIPYIYFKTVWKYLSSTHYIVILIAEKDKEPIGAMLLFHFRKKVIGDYLGWNRTYETMSPSIFLYWQAIQYAHQQNAEIFDFGRTFCLNKKLMDFKERWNPDVGDIVEYYYPPTETSNHQPKEDSKGYKRFVTISKSIPMPLFRLLSNFIYHHLG